MHWYDYQLTKGDKMKKKNLKLTEAEISKINELYHQGRNVEQIRKALNAPMGVVRYHVERIILATINDPALAPEKRRPKGQEDKVLPIEELIKEIQEKSKLLAEFYRH